MPVAFFVGVAFVVVLLTVWVVGLVLAARSRRNASRWGSQLSPQDDAAARGGRAGGGVGAGSAMGVPYHPGP